MNPTYNTNSSHVLSQHQHKMPFHININLDSIIKSAACNMEAVSAGVMTVGGYLSSILLSFTISRIFLAAIVIPLYVFKVAFSLIPSTIKNSINLITPTGWSRLVQKTEEYRSRSDTLAHSQLEGSYRFKRDEIFHVEKGSKGWMQSAPWANDTHEFDICGATVRYIHLRASYSSVLQDGRRTHRPIVFLHGNLSWSYLWRNVISLLLFVFVSNGLGISLAARARTRRLRHRLAGPRSKRQDPASSIDHIRTAYPYSGEVL